MTIALIIILILGGGTSFAAENALPGDTLYTVKISVNEEVRSLVAVSSVAQADWDARRAGRRLEEAEKLAVKGRLNAEARADIEARFESHAEAFKKHAEKIEAKQDTKASFEVHSNFEASLKAHEQVLAQLAAEKANVRAEVELLLVRVHIRLNETVKARSDIEAKISAEADGQFTAAAEGKLKATENKISEVRGFITRMKASISADAYVQAEARLKIAESVVVRGKAEMEARTYGKAFASFQEALRIAQEAKLVVISEKQMNIEVKIPGVNVRSDSSQETSSTTSVKAESETKMRSGSTSTEVQGEGKVKIDIGL